MFSVLFLAFIHGLIHKTNPKVKVQNFYLFLFSALTDVPQEWIEEKKEDVAEPTDSTEVLRSWEDPTTAPQPETIAEEALEIVASAEVDREFKDYEGEVEVSPSIEEHGDAQTVVVSEEVEGLAESVQEERERQGETPAVSGEGPISSSEAEEDVEEEPVLSETCVSETAEGLDSKKEVCDITTWITHSEVLCESSEQGEPLFYSFQIFAIYVKCIQHCLHHHISDRSLLL